MFLEVIGLVAAVISTGDSDWRFECPVNTTEVLIQPDFRSLSLIFYDYYSRPAFDPGYSPILRSVKLSQSGDVVVYTFSFDGRSSQFMHYELNFKGQVIDSYLSNHHNQCS